MAKNKKSKNVPLSVLRQSKGVSQRELASQVHVSPGTIGLYETGKRNPTLEIGLRIATFFDVPVDMIQFDCRNAK
ncbi:MAG: helix-turn-helix transcriptional regulator [Butyrivibrio sp.]|nr:helix-turn-helix transcriptional regulator [Butyrivibrio sp.]